MTTGIQELWCYENWQLPLGVFEPANQFFWQTLESEHPDLVKKFTPWDRISDSDSLRLLLESAGVRQIQVSCDTRAHLLSDPEDWWIMILGSGCRGTIEQLDPEIKERIRVKNLDFLRSHAISALDVEVLSAVGQKG
jgi:hypothetical protein